MKNENYDERSLPMKEKIALRMEHKIENMRFKLPIIGFLVTSTKRKNGADRFTWTQPLLFDSESPFPVLEIDSDEQIIGLIPAPPGFFEVHACYENDVPDRVWYEAPGMVTMDADEIARMVH